MSSINNISYALDNLLQFFNVPIYITLVMDHPLITDLIFLVLAVLGFFLYTLLLALIFRTWPRIGGSSYVSDRYQETNLIKGHQMNILMNTNSIDNGVSLEILKFKRTGRYNEYSRCHFQLQAWRTFQEIGAKTVFI